MKALTAWQTEHKQIAGFPGAETIASDAFWRLEMDILIPAALEGQITRQRAEALTCKLVLEGANGPTYPDADDVLASRGILVVPDVVCNAGGVTVSYFEWPKIWPASSERRRDQRAHGQNHDRRDRPCLGESD